MTRGVEKRRRTPVIIEVICMSLTIIYLFIFGGFLGDRGNAQEMKEAPNDRGVVQSILNEVLYVTIATVSKEGLPWNTPVFFARDHHSKIYWVSANESVHSKNIENSNH